MALKNVVTLAAPVQPGQPIDVARPAEATGGSATQVLLKTQALELIRLVLPQGKAVPPHAVRGELTVHCLEGELVLAFDGSACHLGPGQLVLLPAGTEHAIHAASDASALLTVQIPGGAGERGPASAPAPASANERA